MLSGGFASALASVSTTPFDVVKTRLATGVIPQGTSMISAFSTIVAADGISGLFVGAQTRLLSSALFGGVGFASFEICKHHLGL